MTITQISGIESIVENFAGDDIDRLIFEEMMKKLDKQVKPYLRGNSLAFPLNIERCWSIILEWRNKTKFIKASRTSSKNSLRKDEVCFIICTAYTNRWALGLQGGKDLNSNIPDVDSLYRNGDEDCDLVEVVQKDEIVKYYHAKVCENIEKAKGVCKGLLFIKFIFHFFLF